MSRAEEIIFILWALGMIFLGFGILGIVSDFILPHCKWLNDWIDTLPIMQNETKAEKKSHTTLTENGYDDL